MQHFKFLFALVTSSLEASEAARVRRLVDVLPAPPEVGPVLELLGHVGPPKPSISHVCICQVAGMSLHVAAQSGAAAAGAEPFEAPCAGKAEPCRLLWEADKIWIKLKPTIGSYLGAPVCEFVDVC